jgi:hypothetical protein
LWKKQPAEESTVVGGFNSLASKISKIFSEAWGWLANPYDPLWRSHEKYHHEMKELQSGILLSVQKRVKPGNAFEAVYNELIHIPQGQAAAIAKPAENNPKEECLYHLRTALKLLFEYTNDLPTQTASGDPFTPRERYQAFMKAYNAALNSAYYKQTVQDGRGFTSSTKLRDVEENDEIVAALHAIARAQFTGVHVSGFLDSLATLMAKAGHASMPPVLAEDQFNQASPEIKKKNLFVAMEQGIIAMDPVAEGIAQAEDVNKMHPTTSWASSMGHQAPFSHYDSLNSGNLTNVHYQRQYPDDSQVTFIRTPFPAMGSDVHPSFKAFLRSLNAENEQYVYFNLHSRRPMHAQPGLVTRMMDYLGFHREDLLVKNLENLAENTEFKEVLSVVTLDKSSPFYRQKQPEVMDKTAFMRSFVQHLFDTNSSSFSIPYPFNREEYQHHLVEIIQEVGQVYFGQKQNLTSEERQDFIEITYDLIEDYILYSKRAKYANTTSTECLDTGNAELVKKQGRDLLLEVQFTDPEEYREDLLEDVQGWYKSLSSASLSANKRPIHSSSRQTLKRVMRRMKECAQNDPEGFLRLYQMAHQIVPQTVKQDDPKWTGNFNEALHRFHKPFVDLVNQINSDLLKDLVQIAREEKTLEDFEPPHREKLIACIRDCQRKLPALQEYFRRFNKQLESYQGWKEWREKVINRGEVPNRMNRNGVNEIHAKMTDPTRKFFDIFRVCDAQILPLEVEIPTVQTSRKAEQIVRSPIYSLLISEYININQK